jgi:hypothetical protein
VDPPPVRVLLPTIVAGRINREHPDASGQIIHKLRAADRLLRERADVATVAKHLGMSEQIYHR